MILKLLFKKLFLLFLLLASNIFCIAQNPMYYTIGENELNDVDIYSLKERKNGDLYIATNSGLFKYSNATFTRLKNHKKQKGNSLFFLVESTKGALFCLNLKGQVYIIKNNKLEPFYTIPKEDLIAIPRLLTDSKGNLIVVSKKITILNSEGTITEEIKNFEFVDKTVNNEIIIGKTDSEYYFLHRKKKILNLKKSNNSYNYFIRKYKTKKHENYNVIPTVRTPYNNPVNSFKAIKPNTFLARLITGGLQEVIFKNDTIKLGEKLFKNMFFSAFTKGKDGTLFLGTFKQGIRIIPNFDFSSIKTPYIDHSLVDFSSLKNDDLYLYIRDKGLIYYNPNTKNFSVIEKSYNNTKVISTVNSKLNHTPNHPHIFSVNKDLGGLKDFTEVDEKTILLASFDGIITNNTENLSQFNWENSKWNSKYKRLVNFETRVNSINYDKKKKIIYAGTQDKLLRIDKRGISEIKINEASIEANSLVLEDGKLFIGTQKNGVLIYQNDKVKSLYNIEDGLASKAIRKIDKHKDYLFVLNKNFFQYINLKTDEITPLNKSEGIIGFVNNFHISNHNLWILTDNTNLISLPLSQLKTIHANLDFQIDSILVKEKKINYQKNTFFKYNENNITCYAHIKNDANRELTQIKYQLIGFDKNINTLPKGSKKIAYNLLPSGSYTLKAFAQYGTIKSKPFTYVFNIATPFWKSWWFTILCISLLSLCFIGFYNYRMRLQERKNEEKLKQQQIETDLITAKLTALRSQMNPHFIFNALNSIQNLILKQDTHTSYDYIVLFSKLVRNTLNYSEEEFIGIEEETEFLDIYLQLEKLRFGDEFTYKIDTYHVENIEIPPLIIQPFIENALLHGLLNKKGSKELHIVFNLENNQLTCTITDNGIGRKKSAAIQERQGKTKKSFALRAIRKRLNILKKQHSENLGYTFEDLYKNNESIGTKVMIILPYR